ncbi:MAG: transposase [Tildeniella torsiva UHER 1998/13D]|jgi:transposase-like protein|nr:transposase [Tildeniella torsiva UHER 1998/13D]
MTNKTNKARIKYSEAIVNVIVGVLEQGGSNLEAANAVGMDRNTLYLWRNKYPEFKARIEAAKAVFTAGKAEEVLDKLDECKSLAESYVLRLFKGEVVHTKTRVDGKGGVIFKDTEIVLPSDRLLERFLQLGSAEKEFTLNIGLAQPDDDLDDFEFSELSEPED